MEEKGIPSMKAKSIKNNKMAFVWGCIENEDLYPILMNLCQKHLIQTAAMELVEEKYLVIYMVMSIWTIYIIMRVMSI